MANTITTNPCTNVGIYDAQLNATIVDKDGAMAAYGFFIKKTTSENLYDIIAGVYGDPAIGDFDFNVSDGSPLTPPPCVLETNTDYYVTAFMSVDGVNFILGDTILLHYTGPVTEGKRAWLHGLDEIRTPYPSTVLEGVGTGDYEVTFDIFIPVPNMQVKFWDGVVSIEANVTSNPKVMAYNAIESLSIPINTELSISVARVSGTVTITCNDEVIYSGANTYDFAALDTAASEAGYWKPLFADQLYFMGACGVKNLKFYKNHVLVLDMPLTADLSEVENSLAMTEVEKYFPVFWADKVLGGSIPETNNKYIGKIAGDWTDYQESIADELCIRAGNAGLLTQSGGSIHYGHGYDISIPEGSTINSAKLIFYPWCAEGIGDGGAGCKTKIWGHKSNDSLPMASIADYQARCGTVVGGADNTLRTTAEVAWDDVTLSYLVPVITPELKTIISEIQGLGDITGLTLFVHDHAGQSEADKYYNLISTVENMVIGLSPQLIIDYASAAVSKKVMIKRN